MRSRPAAVVQRRVSTTRRPGGHHDETVHASSDEDGGAAEGISVERQSERDLIVAESFEGGRCHHVVGDPAVIAGLVEGLTPLVGSARVLHHRFGRLRGSVRSQPFREHAELPAGERDLGLGHVLRPRKCTGESLYKALSVELRVSEDADLRGNDGASDRTLEAFREDVQNNTPKKITSYCGNILRTNAAALQAAIP